MTVYGSRMNRLPRIYLIGKAVCTRDWKLPPRKIEEYELIAVFQGKAEFTVEGSRFRLVAGDCLLICPNAVHSGFSFEDDPCRFYYTHFKPDLVLREIGAEKVRRELEEVIEGSISDTSRRFFFLPRSAVKDVYIPRFISLERHAKDVFTLFEKALAERNHMVLISDWMISSYVQQILMLLMRRLVEDMDYGFLLSSSGEMPSIVQKAVFKMDREYKDKMSMSALCKELQVTQQYMIRLFKKHLSMTPLQYVNRVRMEKAKELIRSSLFSVKQIADAVGIDNPYYFSRLFKKMEGITPTGLKKGVESRIN